MWQWIAAGVGLVGTPWAIVAYIARRVIRGDLISRQAHLDRVADLKASISALEATVTEKDRQIGILLGRPTS